MYAFCKSANMNTSKTSAAYVERVRCLVVTRNVGDGIPMRHRGDGPQSRSGEPSLRASMALPRRATRAAEGLVDQSGSRVFEDAERIAARVFEHVAWSGWNLDGLAFRLPASRAEVLRSGLQVLHFEERE